MKRLFWITFGCLAQIAFTIMVPFVFLWFYQGSDDPLGLGELGLGAFARSKERTLSVHAALLVDLLLLFQFGIPHSVLLLPAVRDRIERFVPTQLYGALFSLVATGSLLLGCWLWQPLPGVVYETTGVLAWLLLACYIGSWILMVYSVSLTGLGWQSGLTPWWCYLRNRPVPRRVFATDNLYGWLRHPVYLGFLGLIWFTPRMTSDHLLRGCVWTVYVYVGSVLKDRRLLFYLGGRYRDYMERVRGYPLIFWGPLARPGEPGRVSARS